MTSLIVLWRHQLYADLAKCFFVQTKLQCSGHIIFGNGILVDPSKVRMIIEWPTPTSVIEVKSFMGLVGYYYRFVEGLSRSVHPITSLKCRGKKFGWIEQCERAFQTLKECLTNVPIPIVPNSTQDFVVCTDASLDGIGVLLMQEGPVIAYES